MDYFVLEKEVFNYINDIRINPKIMITELKERLQNFSNKIYKDPNSNINLITNEGPKAVQDAVLFLDGVNDLNPFILSKGLSHAAKQHADDIGSKGIASHTGSDGSEMNTRCEKFGEWNKGIAENIAFTDKTAKGLITQLIIDDGIVSRGHRKNLLSPDFKYIGIGCSFHKTYELVCVITFAIEYKEYFGDQELNKIMIDTKPTKIKEPNIEKDISDFETCEDWPKNAVRCEVQKECKIIKNIKKIKVKKIYTMKDGSIETEEREISEIIK